MSGALLHRVPQSGLNIGFVALYKKGATFCFATMYCAFGAYYVQNRDSSNTLTTENRGFHIHENDL